MKTAVLGYGTVGKGIAEMLRGAAGLSPGPVLVRPGKKTEPFQVTDLGEILADESVGAVAEAMGGVEPAFSYAMRVLESGRHFVTANKALVAAHGIELAAAARAHGAAFLFSAACGGGMPLLHNMALAAESDRLLSVSGILNGTTNYMLDAMQSRDMDYADALKDAQALGYAEADPTADVSGLDAARKIVLACAVAWSRLPAEGLDVEGIESFTAADVRHLRSLGLACRLIASGGPAGDTVSAGVEPCIFDASAPESSVKANFNMARYEGVNCGPMIFMGQGAGRWPTASAVLRDLTSILQGQRTMLPADCKAARADNSGVKNRYYVRMASGAVPAFPIEKLLENGPAVRAVTGPLSVREMHAAAKTIRKDGGEIFFAAVQDGILC